MPVIYECDGEGCEVKEDAMCVLATFPDGKQARTLVPPFRWRMLEIPTRAAPAVLCPSCGAKVDAHQRAANDPPPLKKRPVFGVLDGGKGKNDDEPT